MAEDPSSIHIADEQLVSLILSSPDEGWRNFWDTHGRFIQRIIGRFDLCPEDIEEVRQEVCHSLIKDNYKILRAWDSEICSLRGFLSVITAHAVSNYFRSSFHRFNLKRVDLERDTEDRVEVHSGFMAASFSASERLYRVQVTRFLRKSLDEWVAREKLSPTDRELVLLRMRGLSFKEISALTGMTTSHATVRFTRLKPLLKKRLEEAGICPTA